MSPYARPPSKALRKTPPEPELPAQRYGPHSQRHSLAGPLNATVSDAGGPDQICPGERNAPGQRPGATPNGRSCILMRLRRAGALPPWADQTPRHQRITAFCACSRFSASSKITDCGPSITAEVTSSSRCAGKQCINSASGFACAINASFT